jgi:hypothetical protein
VKKIAAVVAWIAVAVAGIVDFAKGSPREVAVALVVAGLAGLIASA